MKARFGNKIIDVVPDDGRWLDPRDMTYYDADQLVFEKEVDWAAFRREAAKDILAALCSFPPINYKEDVQQAINIADELIKQLKEEKK